MTSRWTGILAGVIVTAASIEIAPAVVAQSFTPQPIARFTPGTLAQDLAISPKGGWVYMVGSTTSADYPVTADAFDRTCGTDGACNIVQGRFGPERRSDIVLTVFDATGTIQYSTFIGGEGQDDNPRIAVARDGTVWLAGNKSSAIFENASTGCGGNLWIARFEFTLRRIEQFLCLNGPTLADTALDADGSLWLLGTTGIPVATQNAFQPNIAGQLDMFVAQISPSESSPLMATHIGGSGLDTGAALALTPAGDIAIVGATNSRDFPLVRPLRTTPPGSNVQGDAAIVVLDRSGRFLEFSTYWGGIFDDSAGGVAVDSGGNLYVIGQTASRDMPTTLEAFDRDCDPGTCRDAFIVKLNAVGELMAATYYGASGFESGRGGIAVRPNGQVLAMGSTQSPDFALLGGQPFRRWRAGPNFEHSWLAVFDNRLERLTRAVFVGDEDFLPNAPHLIEGNGFAYVAGQVGTLTSPAGFGTYLSVVPLQ